MRACCAELAAHRRSIREIAVRIRFIFKLPARRSRLLRFLHLFGESQHGIHTVPVSRRTRNSKNFVEAGPWKLRTASAIREVNVEFASNQMEFFRIVLEPGETLSCIGPRLSAQKADQYLAGLQSSTLCKGAGRNRLS